MHIDYAKEVLQRNESMGERRGFSQDEISQRTLESICDDEKILAVADSMGDEKISSICATIRDMRKDKYRNVTHKQRYAITAALLEEYKTASHVLAAAFNVSSDQFEANK